MPLDEKLADLTAELCRIASPIGHEGAICDWLEKRIGPAAVREGHSLVVRGSVNVALVGHIDTVPAFPGDGPVRREGPRLYGKGSSDMKGGVAVMLSILETLPPLSRPHLIFYEREEGPFAGNGLEPLFAKGLVPKADLAICLEPTDNTLQLGCVGSLHATVRFRGKSAHSARPWEGANAVHAAGAMLARLGARERRPVVEGGLTFYEVTQVTHAAGGRASNVVPDLFELNLNHRFAPGVSAEQAQADVRALVGEGAEVSFTDVSPSGPTCADHPRVLALKKFGLEVLPKQAWTDVARFGLHGIAAVNFGPGQPAQAHQVDEWCDVPSLGKAHAVLEQWLRL